MKEMTVAKAIAFVDAIKLPKVAMPKAFKKAAPINFDETKEQAMVVRSEVVAFAKGITEERKKDINNAALLAQLAANKKVPDRDNVFVWYKEYFDVLSHIGWVIQETDFKSYEERADGLEAHQAILNLAAEVLGAASTAFAVVTAIITAMKSMAADNPWITLFEKESHTATAGRFQISLVEQDKEGQFMVSIIAFGLKAKSTITQILFFKFQKIEMTLKNCSGKVTINTDILEGIREKVKKRLGNLTDIYVGEIDI